MDEIEVVQYEIRRLELEQNRYRTSRPPAHVRVQLENARQKLTELLLNQKSQVSCQAQEK